MSFIAGILTFLVVVNCFVLVLLVLMQLPKKDAGAGMAFGGAAADALFGAGSGNFLTQATKYATIVFFVLALILGQVESKLNKPGGSEFEKKLQQQQQQAPAPLPTPSQTLPSTPTLPTVPNTPIVPGATPAVPTNGLSSPPAANPPPVPPPSSNAQAAPKPAK